MTRQAMLVLYVLLSTTCLEVRLTTVPELQQLLATFDPDLLIMLKHVQARLWN